MLLLPAMMFVAFLISCLIRYPSPLVSKLELTYERKLPSGKLVLLMRTAVVLISMFPVIIALPLFLNVGFKKYAPEGDEIAMSSSREKLESPITVWVASFPYNVTLEVPLIIKQFRFSTAGILSPPHTQSMEFATCILPTLFPLMPMLLP